MKQQLIGAKIILGAFIVIICFSWLWWGLFGSFIDTNNYENRNLATAPQFTPDNYLTYSKDYTNYFNDTMPFRNNLITLNNEIDYFIFHKSSNDNVIIGENNWLFYSQKEDGDSIACYQGSNLYTDKELAAIAQNCVNQRDVLLSEGKDFVIFIAPNKERIYSEYMPSRYGKPAENYGVLQIYNYLKKNTDLTVVYPYAELMDAKEHLVENIYYKTDTHWNDIGGYVGASALVKELGIYMPQIYDEQISIIKEDKTAGDLAGMLNLVKELRFADHDYTIEGYNLHNREELLWEELEMISYRAYDADPRTIYIIRDSFSAAMAPYIGSQFNTTYLRFRESYTYEDLIKHNPDIVVYETVERYAGNLASFRIR